MKNIDEHIDLIERYLYDDLTQEELEEFNDLLRENTEFNKLFYEMDHLLDGIRRSAKQTTVEEKLARLEEALPFKSNPEINQESTNTIKRIIDSANMYLDQFIARLFNLDREEIAAVPINSRGQASTFTVLGRIKLIAASSIILIFLVATFVYVQFSQLSPVELYAVYYEKPNLPDGAFRSSDIEKSEIYSLTEIQYSANIEFNNSNFGKALNILESIPDNNKTPSMLYCTGLSYMEIDDFAKARKSFNQLIDDGDVVWKQKSRWFLALCHLRENNMVMAAEFLKDVSEVEGGDFQKEAIKLLEQISN